MFHFALCAPIQQCLDDTYQNHFMFEVCQNPCPHFRKLKLQGIVFKHVSVEYKGGECGCGCG